MTRLTGLVIFLAFAPGLFGGSNAEPVQQEVADPRADCIELCEHDDCSKGSDGVRDC